MTAEEFDKFNEIEKKFLSHLQKIHSDLHEAIRILRKTNNSLLRSELCLAFIAADTFSRVYKILQGSIEEELDKNQGKRFKLWFKNFVFTEKNKIYNERRIGLQISLELIWELRNATIHFYGLPSHHKTGEYVGFSSGDEKLLLERINKFNTIGDYKVRLIQPYWLIDAIDRGFLLQLQSMMEMIRQNPDQYIRRILLAHKIVMTEGAEFIADGDEITKKW